MDVNLSKSVIGARSGNNPYISTRENSLLCFSLKVRQWGYMETMHTWWTNKIRTFNSRSIYFLNIYFRNIYSRIIYFRCIYGTPTWGPLLIGLWVFTSDVKHFTLTKKILWWSKLGSGSNQTTFPYTIYVILFLLHAYIAWRIYKI